MDPKIGLENDSLFRAVCLPSAYGALNELYAQNYGHCRGHFDKGKWEPRDELWVS